MVLLAGRVGEKEDLMGLTIYFTYLIIYVFINILLSLLLFKEYFSGDPCGKSGRKGKLNRVDLIFIRLSICLLIYLAIYYHYYYF